MPHSSAAGVLLSQVQKSFMLFNIKSISFDFEDDNFELPVDQQQDTINDAINTTWEVDDEEDLVEEITTHYGWCVNNIDYEIVLTDYSFN